MCHKVIISFIIYNILSFSILSQKEYSNNFNLEWGTLERSPGSLLEILPQNNNDFYSLRWSGGRAFGTYRIVDHQNLQQANQGRIKQVAQSGIANFETAYYIGDRIYVFLSGWGLGDGLEKRPGCSCFIASSSGAPSLWMRDS